MRRHPDQVYAAAIVLNEEQHVQPAQQHRVHVSQDQQLSSHCGITTRDYPSHPNSRTATRYMSRRHTAGDHACPGSADQTTGQHTATKF
jgi:hypothetical protein